MSPEVMQVGAGLNQRSRAKYVAEAKKRVAKGAAWLDTERPRWWRSVKVTMLDMEKPSMCVLGQVFAKDAMKSQRYDRFISHGYDIVFNAHQRKITTHGFNVQGGGPTYDELHFAWLDEIRARRNASRNAKAR